MTNFIDFLKNIIEDIEIRLVIFNENTGFKTFKNGVLKDVSVPRHIKTLLEENRTYGVFKQEEDYIYIFIVSVTVDSDYYKIIIKDDSFRNNTISLISTLLTYSYNTKFSESNLLNEAELLREELKECEHELSTLSEKYLKLEEDYIKKNIDIDSLKESVEILKNSRQKMLKLIDGLNIPLFSVDLNYDLVNVNKSVGHFAGGSDLPKYIGSKCYKFIFNNNEVCKWCKFEEVKNTKKVYCQHIEILKDSENYIYEHTMYPIFDNYDNVVEVGEYLNDITEQYRLVENLKKSKEQIVKFSKEKIESINEISALKYEYNNLLEAYETAQTKIKKLSVAMQKLLEQNTVSELLALKSENKDLKNKVERLTNGLINYKKLLNTEQKSVNESIKKFTYSLDRLTNIIDKKKKIEDNELKDIYNFLIGQLGELKKYININKEESDGSKSSD